MLENYTILTYQNFLIDSNLTTMLLVKLFQLHLRMKQKDKNTNKTNKINDKTKINPVEKFPIDVILSSGLGISKDNSDKIYDRFRNRLIVPIHDMQGRVVAFGGRSLDGQEPKYLNSPATKTYNKKYHQSSFWI